MQPDAVGADGPETRVHAGQRVLDGRVVADDGGDPVQPGLAASDRGTQQPSRHIDKGMAEVSEALGEVAFVDDRLQGLLVVEFEGGVDEALDVGGGDLQLVHRGVQVATEPGHLG